MASKTSSILLFLLLAKVRSQEETTPSSLLKPRNFNHHAFQRNQILEELRRPETTKQGPVLFPNDAPPPPRPPLIVTSRPLIESISRSELNNTLAQSSQVNNVIRPYLARIKDYRPYQFAVATEAPVFPDYLKQERNGYDYQERTPLPPIFKVFSTNAKQKVLDVQRQKLDNRYDYEVKEPQYHRQNAHYKNDVGNDDYNENKNYAFSYTVKDQKTGDDFSHSQHSSGSATNGEYRVRLPDGRMQIVSYKADENGYQADVRYDDEDKTAGNKIDNHYNDNKYVNDNHFNDNHLQNNNNYDYINDKHHYNDYTQDYNDKQNFQQKVYKPVEKIDYKAPATNDYYNQYSDLSKEYYNDDLSTEYESKSYDYAPHKSKFASFVDSKNVNTDKFEPKSNLALESTVTPSYNDLKDLLVTKDAYLRKIPVEINGPSTTPSTFDFTTERVVLIGGKKSNLYTSVSSTISPYTFKSASPIISVTPSPASYNNFVVSSTPSNYLVSTIASLRNNVDLSGTKPVLSDSYIDRINKYLRFN